MEGRSYITHLVSSFFRISISSIMIALAINISKLWKVEESLHLDVISELWRLGILLRRPLDAQDRFKPCAPERLACMKTGTSVGTRIP